MLKDPFLNTIFCFRKKKTTKFHELDKIRSSKIPRKKLFQILEIISHLAVPMSMICPILISLINDDAVALIPPERTMCQWKHHWAGGQKT